MLANFKKLSVAAAVASTLGVSGAAHAVLQGVPGDALLIPHVIAANEGGTVTNTLIGVIVGSNAGTNVAQFADTSPLWNPTYPPASYTGWGTLSPPKPDSAGCARTDGARLHWYFFDISSTEIVDDTIPVTCEDFVRIDWNYIIESKSLPSALGKPGYMVITDANAGVSTKSGLILWGATYLIQGNWASQAYIPVLPLVDSIDGTSGDEVTYAGTSGAFVANVNPVTAGMRLPSKLTGKTALFSLRYFLDPALKGTTTMVLWFPDNSSARREQSILVYDADERAISARTCIPYELNILEVSPTAAGTDLCNKLDVIKDGLVHSNLDGSNPDDGTGGSAVGKAVNTGFVLFGVNDYRENSSGVTSNTVTPIESSRAGFAFSLIGIGGGAVADQVQTELAHERGIK